MCQLILDVFSDISSDELLPMSKRIGFDGFFVDVRKLRDKGIF